MWPGSYVARVLCGLNIKVRVLYGQGSMWPGYVIRVQCGQGSKWPGYYVTRVQCGQGSMWPGSEASIKLIGTNLFKKILIDDYIILSKICKNKVNQHYFSKFLMLSKLI